MWENYAIHCIEQLINTLEAVLGTSIADMVSKVSILESILAQAYVKPVHNNSQSTFYSFILL